MGAHIAAVRYSRDGRSIIAYIPFLASSADDAKKRADELLREYDGTYVHVRMIGTKHQYSRTIDTDWIKDS